MPILTVDEERSRRMKLWADLGQHDLTKLSPEELRQTRVYGGAQGVWVDKVWTGQLAGYEAGVTVGLLHTGRHGRDAWLAAL